MGDRKDNGLPVNIALSKIVLESINSVVDIPFNDIFQPIRKQTYVQARYMYFFTMVERYNTSPYAIEKYHRPSKGVDHCTVLWGVKVFRNELDTNHETRDVHKKAMELLKIKEDVLKNKPKQGGKSWIIMRKWHRHNSYLTRQLRRTA